MKKGSGIFPDPDPGDPKRPDPTESGSATLVLTLLWVVCLVINVSINFIMIKILQRKRMCVESKKFPLKVLH